MVDFLLVDGHHLAFRSFYGIGDLTRSDGFPTGALYGFIKAIWHLQDLLVPCHTVVFFDNGRSAKRRELFPEYKAHRSPMPEELRLQLPHIREVVQVLGAIKIEELEVEADDLLASLAVREANRGKSVAIASSDKDFAQIISGRITLWYPPTSYGNSAKWIPVDSAAAKEKFGVEPPSMVDYLCLVGDAADNIRGVAGIGVKTAAKWLQAYGSIEEIGRHLSELPPRLAKNFSESAALLERNRRLIRFDLSLPIQEIFDCTIDRERLLEFLRQFEFNGLLRKAMGRRGTRKQVQMTLGSQ